MINKQERHQNNSTAIAGNRRDFVLPETIWHRRKFLAGLLSAVATGMTGVLLLLSDATTAQSAQYCQWVTQCTKDGLKPAPCERVRVCRIEPDKVIPEGSRLKPVEKPRGTL